ncbi:hypothetical protein KZW95_00605 [Slackia exigua]|nr:hypothetical protein [Slackia exigua]
MTTVDGKPIPNLWIIGFGAGQFCRASDWSMDQASMSTGHRMIVWRYCAI